MNFLDLTARRVIMSSMLYYGLDTPILSDATFDAYCKTLADRWDDLLIIRQFCLGSPDEIRSSGMHVKVTSAAEEGAISWLRRENKFPKGRRIVAPEAAFDVTHQVHWRNCGDYAWAKA